MPAITKFQARRGTASAWSSTNPILAAGELGWDTTNAKMKVGDGTTNWNTLPYLLAQDLLLKADVNSPAFTGTVTGITKAMVGLGNVDNTSDATKPLGSLAEVRVNEVIAEKLGAAKDTTSAEFHLIPDRVTGPVGQKLNLPSHITTNVNGEATHPSVAFRPEGWNGYTYWMAFTPYQGANDSMEDPNVVASMDGINWVVPSGLTNPLADAPGSPSNYNSDTDIEFGPDDKLYVFWRNYDPNSATQEKLFYRSSSDGINWGPATLVVSAADTVQRYISPAFIYENGAWTCWYLDMLSTPFRIVRMRSTGKDPVSGAWSAPVPITYSNGSQTAAYMTNRSPWHLCVVKAYGRYHMLVADYDTPTSSIRNQIYMNSPDGKVWLSAIGPCIPRVKTGEYDSMYRATLIPAIQRGVFGFRVWYGAFLSTSNPNQWYVYRTFITDGPRTDRGTFVENVDAAASLSSPSYKARQITFNRDFKYPPDIVLSSSTGFLGVAASGISTTGFQYNIDNPVQSARTNVTFYWSATEPE